MLTAHTAPGTGLFHSSLPLRSNRRRLQSAPSAKRWPSGAIARLRERLVLFERERPPVERGVGSGHPVLDAQPRGFGARGRKARVVLTQRAGVEVEAARILTPLLVPEAYAAGVAGQEQLVASTAQIGQHGILPHLHSPLGIEHAPGGVAGAEQQPAAGQWHEIHDGVVRHRHVAVARPLAYRPEAKRGFFVDLPLPPRHEGAAVGGPGDTEEVAVIYPFDRRPSGLGQRARIEHLHGAGVVESHRDGAAIRREAGRVGLFTSARVHPEKLAQPPSSTAYRRS